MIPLAHQILIRMKAKNLTIPLLEKKAELTHHAVRNIVRGRSINPSAETLNVIARALGCSVDELLEKEIPQEKVLPEEKKENKEKIDTPYDHPELLRETVNFVIGFLEHNKNDLSLEQVLNCIKIIYQESIDNVPPRINDEDAAFWMILATAYREPK